MELPQIRRLPARECLDTFIANHVKATTDSLRRAQSVICNVVRTLQQDTFPYDVAEVFKTGSLGQGTALNSHLSDIDLVVYINGFTVRELTKDIDEILDDLDGALERANLDGYRWIYQDQFRLEIELEACGELFRVDILPGIKVPIDLGLKGMYKKMRNEKRNIVREHYSVSYAKLQRDFISSYTDQLRKLFQLIKYWSKVDLKVFTDDKVPSYLMNLIVIYTWEEYDEPEEFETEIGFKAVLRTLIRYRRIERVWFENYTEETWDLFGEPDEHYLIDPANPSVNMLDGQDWDAIQRAAQSTCDLPVLRDVEITSDWCY